MSIILCSFLSVENVGNYRLINNNDITLRETNIDKLTVNQKNILYFIKDNPKATQVDISRELSLSIQGVKKAVLRLQELDLLERIGSKKDGMWKVKVY